MVCKWQVEIDDYANRVLAKHWPNVPRHDDVRTFPTAERDWSVDLICGGFPCQDISIAGKGAGLAGERSGLWYEFARIIGEIRPSYVIVENVAALLARGMGTVLGDLSTLGYDAEWHVIPASAVGAPHRRERVWIVAHAHGRQVHRLRADAGDGGTIQAEGQQREFRGGDGGQDVSHANGERLQERQGQDASGERANGRAVVERSEWWSTEPDVGRVAHGVPARVDRLRCLGNAVVPQIVEVIGRAILDRERRLTA